MPATNRTAATVTIVSFKSKYIAVAVVAAILVSLAVASVMIFENRAQHAALLETATADARSRVRNELSLRAGDVARHLADRVAEGVLHDDRERIRLEAELQQRDETLLGVVLRNTAGVELYSWRRATDNRGLLTRSAIMPVRASVQAMPGIITPQTVGEVEVEIRAVEISQEITASRAQFDEIERTQLRNALLLAGGLGLVVLCAGFALAWWAGRRVQQPITTLIKSADRIAQGDYSRPMEVGRRDELGELQAALERMRQRLRLTTINKNYLTNVLGSMTDAVFVTSPEGVIRMANQSACKLLAYGEEELCGRSIISIFDERERAEFDLLRASQDTRETVVKTRLGQTIPVAITGSQITTDDPQYQGTIFVVRNVTERKRVEQRIRYLARIDPLTKLANRMQFQHLLQQGIARARRTQQYLAILYLDVDRFKDINDTFGHAAGDTSLEIFARRTLSELPSTAHAGRLAGDEFAVLLTGFERDGRRAAGDLGHRGPLLQATGKPFQVHGEEIFLTSAWALRCTRAMATT